MEITFLLYYLLPTFKVRYEIAKVLLEETPDRKEEIVKWPIEKRR